jgi:ferredoxin
MAARCNRPLDRGWRAASRGDAALRRTSARNLRVILSDCKRTQVSGVIVAYIICEPCVGTKDTACVDVCPVDCIHPRKDEPEFQSAEMLYIHPDECIDCGACVPACPVEAIFALDETPEKWKNFIAVNAEFFQKA